MKPVDQTLLERRSIRRYERENISDDDMALIYEAIRNTPTSYNGQQFSVIDITDQPTKEKLYELTSQKQIKTCNHFLLFLADFNKIKVLAEHKKVDFPQFTHTVDGVIVGVVDATLAMMSALTMAESLGLGTCCIGYARTAAPDSVAQLVKLPQNTFVVCGLAIGVPREMPDLKPKQPLPLVVHHDHYRADSLLPDLEAYDEEVQHYNRTREGAKTTNDWCAHIVSYYREAMSYRMLAALRRRGFDPAQ